MRHSFQSGFTLLELIAVMIITGILAVSVSVRFSDTDIDLQEAKSDVLAALVFARETAMARSDGLSSVTVVAASSSIDVRVNDASIASSYQSYPLSLSSGITISSGTGTLSFNALGETDARMLVLSQSSLTETLTVSGVGYAY